MSNQSIKSQNVQITTLLTGFSAVIVVSLMAGIAGNWWFLAAVPAAVLFGYLAVVDFRKIFYILFFFIPLTVEVWLPNGVVTDMPTEQIAVLLTGIYLLYVLRNGKNMRPDFALHPISLMLLIHLGWMFFTAITSEDFIISLKFSLAKTWYVTPFFFLAGSLLKTEKEMRTLTWVVLIPLSFTILYVLARFAAFGFSFSDVNKVMFPFYRNKVAFACMVSIFLPFAWFMRQGYRKFSIPRLLLTAATVLLLVGVQLSYTRAAYVTIAMGIGAYFMIKWRLMKTGLAFAAIIGILYAVSMVNHNTYLDHKPVYEKTITHEDFNDLLSATTKGQDVSTMERVYRWVAGGHMIAEKPWLGWGPGTFTTFYKTYALAGFRTYVSDNKEGSGIHCYYLMTFVEQGFPGMFLFIGLVFFVLLKGEVVYHQTTDPARRRMLSAALVTTVIIDGLLLMNDLVETDKIGSFFFLCMAVIINVDLANKKELAENSVLSTK